MIASPRGGSRSATGGHIDDKGFLDVLSTRIISIECLGNGLVRTQDTVCAYVLIARLTTDDPKCNVGRINTAPKGISIFAEDDISDVVDQVVFGYFDSCGRGTKSFHPYLSLHCWESIMTVGIELRESRNGRSGRPLDDE